MTERLPVLRSDGQKGGMPHRVDDVRARLLIICPLADIYSG